KHEEALGRRDKGAGNGKPGRGRLSPPADQGRRIHEVRIVYGRNGGELVLTTGGRGAGGCGAGTQHVVVKGARLDSPKGPRSAGPIPHLDPVRGVRRGSHSPGRDVELHRIPVLLLRRVVGVGRRRRVLEGVIQLQPDAHIIRDGRGGVGSLDKGLVE